jgi:ribonuclease R
LSKKKHEPGLPTKDALREFIHSSETALNKREIAKAFNIKGQEDRIALKQLLKELAEEGVVARDGGKSYKAPDALPATGLVEIVGLDVDGEMVAKPLEWQGRGAAPTIFVTDNLRSEGGLSPGDQILVRMKRVSATEYEARILKTLDDITGQIIGVFKPYKDGGYVYPTNKKVKEDYFVPHEFAKGFAEGDLVVAEKLPVGGKYPRSKNPVRIVKRLGKKDDPRLISLIAIHSHGIPTEFSKEALHEAEGMEEPDLSGGRVDLRAIPLVTIDGADARDFDDAVFAEPDQTPGNEGGWHLLVAIADVSYYVRPNSALDRTALERGNSTYFADRVVPMLPERLSNDLCSLKPKVNRACLACHLYIDKNGKLIAHQFIRGLMRSAARLTYEEVENAHKGYPDDATGPLLEPVIKPLYKAYSILKHARELRGALEIDLPERKAVIDDKGMITAIVPRHRLESHQLIEEFMILANVATAEALEKKNAPCVYRIHDSPSFDRLENTRLFLKELGYSLPKAEDLKPKNLNHILRLSADKPDKELIHTLLLRTQSQAIYSPDNLGHFGLALERYAHFTSPIRRYADLVVHRALVRSHRLGDGGLEDAEMETLHEIAEHISQTERRSMLAERDVMDRFTAQYLSTNVGKEFPGKVSGVTHFGLFVSLNESGADGIVPMRSLPRDYYIHDEKRHALVGKQSGSSYRLAQPVIVRLMEADAMRGSTVFELVDAAGGDSAPPPRRNFDRDRRRDKPAHKNKKAGEKHRRGKGGKKRR